MKKDSFTNDITIHAAEHIYLLKNYCVLLSPTYFGVHDRIRVSTVVVSFRFDVLYLKNGIGSFSIKFWTQVDVNNISC